MKKAKLLKALFSPRGVLFIRIFLGIVFIYAGAIKINDPQAFANIIGGYAIVPFWLLNIVAIVLPCVEVLLGIILPLPFWRRGSAILATLLFAVFLAAITTSVARGIDIDCGCFSTEVGSNPVTWLTICRDIIFLILGAYVLFREYRRVP
ncbi:MAG: DoxX family membrane protein [Deltaproteobacteria bacterium]|nr:DoxX family membrane protein [Deltaproteobacteria bacterium]